MITDSRAGNVFMLDFDDMELREPEMVKRRMVAVLSPRGLNRSRNLVTIIALSTSPPRTQEKHVVPLSQGYYWSKSDGPQIWAKCDMIYTVAMDRLQHLAAYHTTGRRTNYFAVPRLNAADLKNIRVGLIHAVGADQLIEAGVKREFNSYILTRFKELLPRLTARRSKPQ